MSGTTYKFRNPQTGNIGDIPADRLQEAIADGMEPAQDLEMINPQTGGKGVIPAAGARQALADGMLPVGARAEQAQSMSTLEAGARAVGSGAAMGWDDEIISAARSLFSPKKYEELRDEYREASKAAEEKLGGWYTGLQVAGGIGGAALMPGSLVGRGLAAGSKAAIGNAIGQGAVTGLGMSEEEGFRGQAIDAATGGAVGGVAAKVLPAVAGGVKSLAKGAYEAAENFMSPAVNRAVAVGATAGDLKGAVGKITRRAVDTITETGLFKPGELDSILPDAQMGASFKLGEGGRPDKKALWDRINRFLPFVGKQIGDTFEEHGGGHIDIADKVLNKAVPELDKIVRSQEATAVGTVEKNIDGWIEKLAASNGNIKKLWELGQDIGASGAYNRDPRVKTGSAEAAEVLYKNLNEALLDAIESSGDSNVRALKQKYAAALTVRDLLDKGIAKEATQPKIFGVLDKGSTMAGATGAGIGYAVGGPVGAQIASGAATALNQFTTSTRGMLWRADMGDKLTQALGKIPRSAKAIREAIANNPQQFVPLLGPGMYQAIQKMPQKVWENEVRILMPMLEKTDAFAPSDFPTEVDGKIAAADKFMATKKIEDMDMQPSAAAMRISMINKSGQLPPELRARGYDEYLAQIQGGGE